MKLKIKKLLILWTIGIFIVISFTLFAKLTGIGRLFEIRGPAYSLKEVVIIFIRNPLKYLALFLIMGGLVANGLYLLIRDKNNTE